MTRVATGWLVYKLTGSATLLGAVSFAGQIPAFFPGPLAGVLVDRWDRQRTLVLAGLLGAHIGTPEAIVMSGAPCMAGAVWFARTLPAIRKQIRPIYQQLGILPEAARGVQ